MAENQESKSVTSMLTDEQVLVWMEEHLAELRHSVSGQSILYQSLAISFVVGLAAHVGGYVLLSSVPNGLLGLLADLLHALGWSLWTGVVVAVFVQVIPEAKRRQIKGVLHAYEAIRREKAQTRGDRAGAVLQKPAASRGEREPGQKQRRNRTRKGE